MRTRTLSFLVALVLAGASFAGPKELAAAEDALGTADFEKALSILDRELKRTKTPPEQVARVHMLRAEALHALNRREHARDALRKALELTPAPQVDTDRSPPTFVALLEDVRAEVLGEVQVTADRPGALVNIDGNPFGPAPLRTRIPVGPHKIEVRAGDASASQSVVVHASQPVSLSLTLVDPPRTAVTLPPKTTPTSAGIRATTVEHRGAAAGGSSGVVRWIPGAAGVVLGGAGAYFLVRAVEDYRTLETGTGIDGQRAADLRDSGERNQTLGGAGVILGVAGMATTAVLLAVGGSDDEGPKVSVVPTSNALHIGISGEWP